MRVGLKAAKGSRHLEEVLVEGVGPAVDGVRLAPREPARVEAVGRALLEDVRDRARLCIVDTPELRGPLSDLMANNARGTEQPFVG